MLYMEGKKTFLEKLKIFNIFKLSDIKPVEIVELKTNQSKITKLGESAVEDGSILVWEGDEDLKVNDLVYVQSPDGELPAPAGSYVIENGDTVIVESINELESVVKEIMKAEAAAPEEAVPAAVPVEQANDKPAAPVMDEGKVKSIVESITKNYFSKEEGEAIKAELSAIKKENESLKTQLSAFEKKPSEAAAKKPVGIFAELREHTKNI